MSKTAKERCEGRANARSSSLTLDVAAQPGEALRQFRTGQRPLNRQPRCSRSKGIALSSRLRLTGNQHSATRRGKIYAGRT